jgi:hypothetical protein
MRYLQLPAHVITRDWNVQGWNKHILKLLGWNEQKTQFLQQRERLNVLHLIFDKDIELRNRLCTPNGTWEDVAMRNVYGFKMTNVHCRYDDWYQNLVNDLMQFEDFERIWKAVDDKPMPIRSAIEYITEIIGIESTKGESIRFRSSFVSNGDIYYPLVSVWLPIDHNSRQVFLDLGIPIQFAE